MRGAGPLRGAGARSKSAHDPSKRSGNSSTERDNESEVAKRSRLGLVNDQDDRGDSDADQAGREATHDPARWHGQRDPAPPAGARKDVTQRPEHSRDGAAIPAPTASATLCQVTIRSLPTGNANER